MDNPVQVGKDTPNDAGEGCLSLDGTRRVARCQNIGVEYRNAARRTRRGKYSGWIARIIWHEMDHMEGTSI